MATIDDEDLRLITLDRNKPIDRVVPPESGAHFYQDGIYFGVDGTIAPDYVDDKLRTRLARMKIKKQAEAAASRARSEALRLAGVDPSDPEYAGLGLTQDELEDKIAGTDKGNDSDSSVDLLAWAKGQRKYSIAKLRKAAADTYNREIASKGDLLDFMVDNGYVSTDEAIADTSGK